MKTLYNTKSPKKAANLSINSDLLAKAKILHINLSQTLEESLVQLVRENQKKLWRQQNSKAIADYNKRIENNGVFSEGVRRF